MKITNVEVNLQNLNNSEVVKGYASILIDNCFAIKNIKIVRLNGKMIVSMPSIKKDDEFIDIAHPINQDTRERLNYKVLNKFNIKLLDLLHEFINVEGYYLGISFKNCYSIDLYKEDTRELVKNYNIEDYSSETLTELAEEIESDIKVK